MEVKNPFGFQLTVQGIVETYQEQVKRELPKWQALLSQDGRQLRHIEEAILDFCRQQACYLTAAVLCAPGVQRGVAGQAGRVQAEAGKTHRRRYRCGRSVRFLCGLVVNMVLTYSAAKPKRRAGVARGIGRRGKEGAGLYPVWALLGIHEGISPALESEAGRMAVLLPSNRAARQELNRRGAGLSENTLRRVVLGLGMQALSARKDQLDRWRRGEVPVGQELAGKRVVVAIDGGRTRLREARKGRRTRRGRRRYHTPWREPKLLVIYVLDETGRMDRAKPALIDGTFLGPDHLMELAAYHLHRLGAVKAQRVEFVADGADWIWDRIDRIIALVGLSKQQVRRAVDIYHVMEQINRALETIRGWTPAVRKQRRAKLKSLLLKSKVEEVVRYLEALGRKTKSKGVKACVGYIRKRAHLMDYQTLRRAKLPIGSGAVESAVRRVINMRLKGPGIFWLADSAEAMLYLRAQELSGRWEEMLQSIQERAGRSRTRTYRWEPTPMSIKKPGPGEMAVLKQVEGIPA